ncbi:MAG: hypothetical protein OEQ53_21700, partial [Saprospiraceae bacterium]|nr:hypothetical protein [Saprospiraceae bacterium]
MHLIKYILFLGIIIPGCPDFFSETEDFPRLESDLEVTRVVATQEIDLAYCANIHVDFTITTTVNGFKNLGANLIHDLTVTSPITGPVEIIDIGNGRYRAIGMSEDIYFVDYTIQVQDDYLIEALRGQELPIRETIEIENPERLNAAHFKVKHASCTTCSDGAILFEWRHQKNPSFIWSTGDTT